MTKLSRCKLCLKQFTPKTSEKYCPDCIARHGTGRNCSRALYTAHNRDSINVANKIRNSWSKFGCTTDIYNALLVKQKHKCAICKDDLALGIKNAVAVDHDHKTGLMRGVLCYPCNMLLGGAKDNPIVLTNAITYLELYARKNK